MGGRGRRIGWRCEGCEKDGRSCDGGDVGADEREEGRHGMGANRDKRMMGAWWELPLWILLVVYPRRWDGVGG